MEQLRLMAILAHPDDESLGTGGILAKYSADGIATHVVTATRGERGWVGAAEEYPGMERLGEIREAELRAAGRTLGLTALTVLDYCDGDLDRADSTEVIAKLVKLLRQVRPQVVVTFDPNGYYGHPDHIAIAQFTTAAIVAAADAAYRPAARLATHAVAKLYYLTPLAGAIEAYQAALGDLVMTIDGEERRPVAWPEWAVTTRVDTAAHWEQVWQAVACHRSQLPTYSLLEQLPAHQHRALWGVQTFYRALSLVNGGRVPEDDLFEGLRVPQLEV